MLFLSVFLACFIEDVYLFVVPPQNNTVVPFTIRSQRQFDFDQEKALGGKREKALSQYVPIYAYVPYRAEEAKKELEALTKRVAALRDPELSGAQDLLDFLHAKFGLLFDLETAVEFLAYQEFENLVAGILTVQESILQNRIVEDPGPLKNKKMIEVLYPKPAGIVAHPAREVITLDEAHRMMKEKVSQLFWHVNKGVLEPVLQISLATLLPNLKYDHKENDKRIENIIERYPSDVIVYKPGDILAPFHKKLGEEDVLLLAAYRDEAKKDLYGDIPWILIAMLFVVVLHDLFLSKVLGAIWPQKPPRRLLLSLLIISIFLCKACLLFTCLPIHVIPFAVLPLLIVLLCNERASATWTTIMGAILISLFTDRTWDVLIFFVFAGVMAVLTSFRVQKRAHLLLPSVAVGTTNVVVLSAFSMDWASLATLFVGFQGSQTLSVTGIIDNSLLESIGWAFAGGLAAGPVAIMLLPLMEVGWHTTSAFKLNRYADLGHPLMKDLLTKSPATYQHTMTVAYLAEAVGQAIKADQSLLRVGAYYHDIGKIANAEFFVENQQGGENPHDDLDPRESARLIIQHVTKGEEMGREIRLPEVVLDLLRQHHGTQLMEFFYDKAVKASQKRELRKDDFRYPGPKPQTVEAAILMIVDAVEAASRSLQKPTRPEIGKMIRLLVMKRVADGQFDECNLSTRQLAKIIQTLVDSLKASFHSRVAYPWQEKAKKQLVNIR
jgi:putative nucleotidyltransferase with HDIG domain